MATPVQRAARSENPSEVAALHGYVFSNLPFSEVLFSGFTSTTARELMLGFGDSGKRPKRRSSQGPSLELAFYSPGPLGSLSFS